MSCHSRLERIDAQHFVFLQLLLQAFPHCRDQLSPAVTSTMLTPTFSSVCNFQQFFGDASFISSGFNDGICFNPLLINSHVPQLFRSSASHGSTIMQDVGATLQLTLVNVTSRHQPTFVGYFHHELLHTDNHFRFGCLATASSQCHLSRQ